MATITRKVCDLCFADGETRDGKALQIALSGLTHEADLCTEHDSKLRADLAPFLKAMRLVGPLKATRTPRRRQPCPNCEQLFTAQGLANHIGVCTGSPVPGGFICDECDKPPFSRLQALGLHRFRAHGVRKEQVLHCQHCPQSFITDERLEAHLSKEHSDMKQLVTQ